jgi:hypothetical protein
MDRLETKPFQREHCLRLQPERRNGQGRELRFEFVSAAKAWRMMRQRPGCRGRGRDRDACGQAEGAEPYSYIMGETLLTAEQMRDPTDVEPETIRAINLDQRRPTLGPAREPFDKCGIGGKVGGYGNEAWMERASVSQS